MEKKKFNPKDVHDVPPKIIKEGDLSDVKAWFKRKMTINDLFEIWQTDVFMSVVMGIVPAFMYLLFCEHNPASALEVWFVTSLYFETNCILKMKNLFSQLIVFVLCWLCFWEVGLSGYKAAMLSVIFSLMISTIAEGVFFLSDISDKIDKIAEEKKNDVKVLND